MCSAKRLFDCVDYLRLLLQFTATFTCKHLLDCFDGLHECACTLHSTRQSTHHNHGSAESSQSEREVYNNTPYNRPTVEIVWYCLDSVSYDIEAPCTLVRVRVSVCVCVNLVGNFSFGADHLGQTFMYAWKFI